MEEKITRFDEVVNRLKSSISNVKQEIWKSS